MSDTSDCFKNSVSMHGELKRAISSKLITFLRKNLKFQARYHSIDALHFPNNFGNNFLDKICSRCVRYMGLLQICRRSSPPCRMRRGKFQSFSCWYCLHFDECVATPNRWRMSWSLLDTFHLFSRENTMTGEGRGPRRFLCWSFHRLVLSSAASQDQKLSCYIHIQLFGSARKCNCGRTSMFRFSWVLCLRET